MAAAATGGAEAGSVPHQTLVARFLVACVDTFWWLVVTVRLYLHVTWLRLNALSARGLSPPSPTTATRRKIVILGDGHAEGVGDWVTCGRIGGLEARLMARIRGDDRVSCAEDGNRWPCAPALCCPPKGRRLHSSGIRAAAVRRRLAPRHTHAL